MKKKLALAAIVAVWLPVAWSALVHSADAPAVISPPATALVEPEATTVIEGPTRRSAPLRAATPKPSETKRPVLVAQVDQADVDEDDAILVEGNVEQQREWRGAWAAEAEDPKWTREVFNELKERGESVVEGDLKLHDLSCRKTVCRLYLQFASRADARAFMAEQTAPALHYEYQRLDPQFEGDQHPQSAFEYEVMIVRTEPQRLTTSANHEGRAEDGDDPVQLPGEDQLITIVSKQDVEP